MMTIFVDRRVSSLDIPSSIFKRVHCRRTTDEHDDIIFSELESE